MSLFTAPPMGVDPEQVLQLGGLGVIERVTRGTFL